MLTKSEKMSLNRAMVILIYWLGATKWKHSGKQVFQNHTDRVLWWGCGQCGQLIFGFVCFLFFFCFSSFLACHFFLFFPILALKTTGYFLLSIPFAHHNHHLLFLLFSLSFLLYLFSVFIFYSSSSIFLIFLQSLPPSSLLSFFLFFSSSSSSSSSSSLHLSFFYISVLSISLFLSTKNSTLRNQL